MWSWRRRHISVMPNSVPDRSKANRSGEAKAERYVVKANGPMAHPMTAYSVLDTTTGKPVDHKTLLGVKTPFLGFFVATDLKNYLNDKEGK